MPIPQTGHDLGSPVFRRMLVALVCAGIATFAQLYSPQGVLQMISADLSIRAEQSALTISAATLGLALAVVPWSFIGDRIGRLLGLVVMTGGFFGAHAVASGWAGARSVAARSQATGLYNLAYYAGSSALGWGVGLVYEAWGWGATVAVVAGVIGLAAVLVMAGLRSDPEDGVSRSG